MKPLAHAKVRLSSILEPDERRALSLAMLEDVVRAALALDAVWVLNSDPDAAAVARALGADPRDDPAPGAGLNPSLAAATRHAVREGASAVLIVSADCAAARPDDLRALAPGEGVALAPDRRGRGTNALWRQPPDVVEVAFGPDSKRAHLAQAHAKGVPVAVVQNERLGLDVDTPRDLDELWRLGWGPASRAALERLGYPQRRNGR